MISHGYSTVLRCLVTAYKEYCNIGDLFKANALLYIVAQWNALNGMLSVWNADLENTRMPSQYMPDFIPDIYTNSLLGEGGDLGALSLAWRTATCGSGPKRPRSVAMPTAIGTGFAPRATPLHNTILRSYEMHLGYNIKADQFASKDNCATWLINLPADVTVGELLAQIRQVGKVFSTFIKRPDFVKHCTAAAQLVFFNPDGAQRFLAEGFCIRQHQVISVLNRYQHGATEDSNGESRVLIITGQERVVNRKAITQFFEHHFTVQVDKVKILASASGRTVLEYSFGGYHRQAQRGMEVLSKERPDGVEHVEYGLDPCASESELASYAIAQGRIHGIRLMI